MKELIVLGSECAVSDHYMQLAADAAEESGIEYTIRKIEDAEEIMKWGVQQGCLMGYCPGCHAVAANRPAEKFTPALVVDGILKIHGGYHGKEEIIKAWTNT